MADYNKVLLMGRLTRDIELKYTPSNMAVANIGLAVGRRYRTKEGENREETAFIDCEAWGKTAEVMNQYLAKGRPVFVEGRLKLDQWQDKDGGKRSKLKVVIENFQFVDSKGDNSGNSGRAPAHAGATGGGGDSSGGGGGGGDGGGGQHQPIAEDDIPF
ncbi:MAG: single-stranded DNA-binding protein [Planctomycetota bacterium]|nr:single-stranded DNA-binding protein [Planctomycetota bacterium]